MVRSEGVIAYCCKSYGARQRPYEGPQVFGPAPASGGIRAIGPKDLVLSHRTSWGILPQTPVFSLRSARCHWYSLITAPKLIYYNWLDMPEGGKVIPVCADLRLLVY